MSGVMASLDRGSARNMPAPGEQLRRFSTGDPRRTAFELGLRTLADAQGLAGSAASQLSALVLYRSTLILFLSACTRTSSEPSSSLAERWPELEQLPELKTALSSLTLTQVPLIVATLTSAAPELEFLSRSYEERDQTLRGLHQLALTLGEQLAVDALGARRLSFTRQLKIAALVMCLVLPLAWFLLKPRNLALKRPVEVSSRSAEHGVDPSRVVDGKRMNLGFHSDEKGPHVVTVDLGAVRRIHRVDVFNRADCCQERAVPLRLEVSSDARSFRTLLVRIDPFSLWKATFPATEARYVRLVQTSETVAFHLSEIEVY